jgi:hypothetical protein
MNDDFTRARLQSPEAVKTFALAGRATLTLQSERTGARFTYRLRKGRNARPGQEPPIFVDVLTGADNESAYSWFGMIAGDRFAHARKSDLPCDAPSAKAFSWAWERVCAGQLPDQLSIWHEGRCGRCNRKLTVPESIESGIGPECAKRGLN